MRTQEIKARRLTRDHPERYKRITLVFGQHEIEVLYSRAEHRPVEAPPKPVEADPAPRASSPLSKASKASRRVSAAYKKGSAAVEERPSPRLRVVVSNDEFEEFLAAAGLNQAGAATVLDVEERTIRRYLGGDMPIPRIVRS